MNIRYTGRTFTCKSDKEITINLWGEHFTPGETYWELKEDEFGENNSEEGWSLLLEGDDQDQDGGWYVDAARFELNPVEVEA